MRLPNFIQDDCILAAIVSVCIIYANIFLMAFILSPVSPASIIPLYCLFVDIKSIGVRELEMFWKSYFSCTNLGLHYFSSGLIYLENGIGSVGSLDMVAATFWQLM